MFVKKKKYIVHEYKYSIKLKSHVFYQKFTEVFLMYLFGLLYLILALHLINAGYYLTWKYSTSWKSSFCFVSIFKMALNFSIKFWSSDPSFKSNILTPLYLKFGKSTHAKILFTRYHIKDIKNIENMLFKNIRKWYEVEFYIRDIFWQIKLVNDFNNLHLLYVTFSKKGFLVCKLNNVLSPILLRVNSLCGG